MTSKRKKKKREREKEKENLFNCLFRVYVYTKKIHIYMYKYVNKACISF